MKAGYHHGDLRAALLAAGLGLLAEGAADSLSLRELARRVGVSATAVYRHFPDKGALLASLAAEGLARLAAAQHAAFEAAGGGGAGFAATGRAYVRFALANPALFRLAFSAPARPSFPPREGAPAPPEALSFLMANAEAAKGAWAGDGRTTALRAWSLAHGLAMLMLDGQVPADDALIDAALGGPAPAPAVSPARPAPAAGGDAPASPA